MKPFERGIETSIKIIDLSNGQLPNNANINDLFYVRKGGTIDDVFYPDNSILISKSNTNYVVSPADFEFYYEAVPLNEVIVNSTNDLSEPTDTGDGLGLAHRLEDGKTYIIGASITLANPIVLSNNTLTGNWGTPIIYTGAGALFRNNSTTPIGISWIRSLQFIGTTTNDFLNITAGGVIGLDFSYLQDFNFGEVSNLTAFYVWDSTFSNLRGKLTIDSVVLSYWHAANIEQTAYIGGDALIHVLGNGRTADFTNITTTPQSGDSLYYLDPTYTGRSILTDSRFNSVLGGTLFKTGSLDQTSPQIALDTFPGGAPDSQTIGSLYMERNSKTTTITAIGLDGDITAFADAGGGQVTVTSIGHGLANGKEVWIFDDEYSGKYIISNVTTDTFEITATFTSTSTGVWETEWVKVEGATLPMNNEEASMTDDNQITFNNLEEKAVAITVATNPKKESSASVEDYEFAVMKNNSRVKGSLRFREMADKAGEGVIEATSTVINGDVFEVYVRNISGTTNMIMENMSVVIK